MGREVFPEWSTLWPKCEYRVIEVPSGTYPVKVIAAIPGSKVEWYSPIDYGREKPEITRVYEERFGTNIPWKASLKDEAKKAYQPLAPEGKEWPPHLALARLDFQDEAAVARFCSLYGLLGLRNIPAWRERKPFLAEDRTVRPILGSAYSGWYDYAPEEKPQEWHNIQSYCEPFELFQEAVEQYQKVCSALERIKDVPEEAETLAWECEQEMLTYLEGCTAIPVFEGGKWILGWRFRSLLEACYFRLLLDLTEGAYGFRRCKNPKCNRLFLATHQGDTYCCIRCRKRATANQVGIREVKRWLRGKWEKGEIAKEQWKAARKEAERLYQGEDGIKDAEALKEAVKVFLKSKGGH